jgi:hypothetical protein
MISPGSFVQSRIEHVDGSWTLDPLPWRVRQVAQGLASCERVKHGHTFETRSIPIDELTLVPSTAEPIRMAQPHASGE